VRSFVLRGGRLTDGQRRALETLWPRWGIEAEGGLLDFERLFGNNRPVILEIGFGNGGATVAMAEAEPQHNFIGVEVHRPGIGRLLLRLEERGIDNVRVACADAVEFLRERVPPHALGGVRIYFPDPWPKKRHHKRRIVQPDFVDLLARKLRAGGMLHMATDWEDYAQHMLEVMAGTASFGNQAGPGSTSSRPDYRPVTKFEQRGLRLGHRVCDLLFERI
jgi:tRNA (guanine-N7-)-methyltransferase